MAGARSHNNLFTNNNQSDDSSNLSTPTGQSPENSPPRNSLLQGRISPEPVSFENMCRETSLSEVIWDDVKEPCCDVDTITEADLKKLQPLLWLDLASLFDKHRVTLDKRKPFKRKRKEEGNVFGVSLNALVRRDQQVTGEDSSLVPLVLQDILGELIKRGAKEEGILRIAGHKQKVNTSNSFVWKTFS